MTVRIIRVTFLVIVIGLLMSACSDTSQLESELAAAEARIAELEAELVTTTSVVGVETITGTMTLTEDNYAIRGDGCFGLGGYDDIHQGTDVVVRDGSGTVIATSSLSDSTHGEVKVIIDNDPNRFILRDRCTLSFAVEVPSGVDFYEVEVANRGGLTYSNADFEVQDWTVAFILG